VRESSPRSGRLRGRYVVSVDGRHDDVLEFHLRRDLCEPQRLERIGRRLRLSRVHVAVAARARARVAEDLEGRSAAPQHSAMFGQRASSQIVCRLAPWISFLTSK
jgi:hypothetical protein